MLHETPVKTMVKTIVKTMVSGEDFPIKNHLGISKKSMAPSLDRAVAIQDGDLHGKNPRA
jgi:hypothetical protein